MRLLAILYVLLSLLLGCTRNEFAGVGAAGDTARVPAGAVVGKVKAQTVIIQSGTGNQAAATDNTKAGQRGGAAATAPQASATASTTKPGVPWWAWLLGGVALGGWLLSKVPANWLRWLPWRAAGLLCLVLASCARALPSGGPPRRLRTIEQAQHWRARHDTPDQRNRRYYRAYPR